MDSSLQSHSLDNSDVKPSFRKLSNETTNRKYRRRSPISGSPSSSSGGSPKLDRSPYYSKEGSIKMSDDRRKRKDDKTDLDRDYGRSRSGKGSDSLRHSERQSYGSSHDYHRHGDHSRHHRYVDDEERGYQRSSRSGRESRSTTHSDHARKESDYDRSRENWRNSERYPRDRSDDRGNRNKDKERETTVLEHHRHNDKDLSSDRSSSGRRQGNSNIDELKVSERGKNRDRGGLDDRREHRRSMGDHKNDNASSQEELRGHAKDLTASRDSGASRLKESHRSSNKEPDRQTEDMIQKRKHDDREQDRERDARNDKPVRVNEDLDSSAKKLKTLHSDKSVDYAEDGQFSKSSPFAAAEKPASSSNQVQENVKLASEPVALSANEVEASNDLNAAKVAAMKAAELVNKNLVGGGYMTADQKRKLLWGNKKNTAAEETGNRWGGIPLFSDKERQEKFNKLMSLRLPWYLWPIVGCERRSESGEQAQRQRWQQSTSSREAGAAPAGFREAIHCWAPSKRWPYSWTWPVITICHLQTLLTILINILFCNLLTLWQILCVNLACDICITVL